MMNIVANSPEHAVELLDRAFNEGDLETILGFYEESAVVVGGESQRLIRGQSELRLFFKEAIRSGLAARQIKTRVIEVDNVALFVSRWSLGPKDARSQAPTRIFVATSVFRHHANEGWKVLIDNPIGPLLLDSE